MAEVTKTPEKVAEKVVKLQAKNISDSTLYLEKGPIEKGDTGEVTAAELSCFEGKYLEKV